MLKNTSLQTRLIASFVVMGGIVLAATYVGWNGTSRLSKHIDALTKVSLPSVTGLWKINEGKTQIQSSMRALANPEFTQADREVELMRIQSAWAQIDQGFRQYEVTPQTKEEALFYRTQFLPHWNTWKQNHEKFLQLYRSAVPDGFSKTETQAMWQFLARQGLPSFKAATDDMLKLLDINVEVAATTQRQASEDV